MIFKELERVPGLPDETEAEFLAVGWLGSTIDSKREPSSEFLDALFLACLDSVWQTRSFHLCPFCDHSHRDGSMKASRMSQTMSLGSAEIHVPGPGDVVYTAPTLIYHYVETHHYEPPEEFVEAVLARYRPSESNT